MTDNINRVRVATAITDLIYDKLRFLSGYDKEDSPEYEELLTKVKRCIMIENKEYDNLSNEELLECMIAIEKNKYTHPSLVRHYSKLKYVLQVREGNATDQGNLLNDVISTKLLVDVLKKLDYKVKSLTDNEEISEEDLGILIIFHKVHKFSYLTSNNFIESLAIKNDFDIESIPRLSFSRIEDRFGIKFLDKAKELFLSYATDSIDELLKMNTEDIHARAYTTLFELSRIECVLEYLDYKTTEALQKYVDYNKNYKDDEVLTTVKRLIRKRKEELS